MEYIGLHLSNGKLDNFKVQDGDKFYLCDFKNYGAVTELFPGVTDLTFEDCWIVNFTVPQDATLIRTTPSEVVMCTNAHSGLVNFKSKCVEQCEHITAYDNLSIDGVFTVTIYKY